MTSFVLGIDIGTSCTAAAIGRRRADGSVDVEPLELGSRKAAVPTVVYLGDDGGVVVGEAAERRAIEQPRSCRARVQAPHRGRDPDHRRRSQRRGPGPLRRARPMGRGTCRGARGRTAVAHHGVAPRVLGRAPARPGPRGARRRGARRGSSSSASPRRPGCTTWSGEARGDRARPSPSTTSAAARSTWRSCRKQEDDAFRVIGVPTGLRAPRRGRLRPADLRARANARRHGVRRRRRARRPTRRSRWRGCGATAWTRRRRSRSTRRRSCPCSCPVRRRAFGSCAPSSSR